MERDLSETSELARMQAFPILGLELFQRPQPNLEMLANALTIEFAGHAGELYFTIAATKKPTLDTLFRWVDHGHWVDLGRRHGRRGLAAEPWPWKI